MAGRNLVAYSTRSGNAPRIANLIQQEVGGTLHEIQPEVPYPSAYDAVVEQAKVEIQAGYKPALRSTLDDIPTEEKTAKTNRVEAWTSYRGEDCENNQGRDWDISQRVEL